MIIGKKHSDVHKLAALASSFSFVRDADETIMDISQIETLPGVNKTLYLTNAWYSEASLREVYKDIRNLPLAEQDSILASFAAPQGYVRPRSSRSYTCGVQTSLFVFFEEIFRSMRANKKRKRRERKKKGTEILYLGKR